MKSITLKIEKWVNDGFSMGFLMGLPVFVKGAIPGEKVVCQLYETTSKYSKGFVESVIEPSPLRREAPCKIYREWGGCSFQHVDYVEEKEIKINLIKNELIFHRIIDPHSFSLDSIVFRSGREYNYRNNVQVKKKEGFLGFYKIKSNDLIPLPEGGGLLLDDQINEILIKNPGKVPIDGKLRKDSQGVKQYGTQTSVFQFNDIRIEVPKDGFFQINQFLLEDWLDTIKHLAEGSEEILELFCGVGLISCYLQFSNTKITGYELSWDSIRYAQKNARINSLPNASFDRKDLYREEIKINTNKNLVCIANPPRAGLGKLVKKYISTSFPEKIIYSSCNYTTLIPDLKDLREKYEVQSIELFDFFPRTPYFETLVVLTKKTLQK